ncbi:flagellar hook-length control protein FliK [Liquorilactobacillus oeni]|uniref:Flagellar hook-length control protein-like C-terminal domain-containing protein n=2 Tax=Liquorilactobacillus oeni TaxID=303241 RepID=A0A0R1MBY7_9LACO|nr:flagellar hook-length control protein FliK [Liquorilactobacillus oeni]AJA34204.1 flagellar hook-length control protein FliK [Liquorilactobacillus oeni]KRL05510.1 hypothetical protein FD46_GL000927 [Liquorilactobacillus oeni DSM 19972]
MERIKEAGISSFVKTKSNLNSMNHKENKAQFAHSLKQKGDSLKNTKKEAVISEDPADSTSQDTGTDDAAQDTPKSSAVKDKKKTEAAVLKIKVDSKKKKNPTPEFFPAEAVLIQWPAVESQDKQKVQEDKSIDSTKKTTGIAASKQKDEEEHTKGLRAIGSPEIFQKIATEQKNIKGSKIVVGVQQGKQADVKDVKTETALKENKKTVPLKTETAVLKPIKESVKATQEAAKTVAFSVRKDDPKVADDQLETVKDGIQVSKLALPKAQKKSLLSETKAAVSTTMIDAAGEQGADNSGNVAIVPEIHEIPSGKLQLVTEKQMESAGPIERKNAFVKAASVLTANFKTVSSSNDSRQVVLQLQPENLGKVKVMFKVSEQQVQLQFKVETAHAKQMLEGLTPRFEKILNDQDLGTVNKVETPAAPSEALSFQSSSMEQGTFEHNQRRNFAQQHAIRYGSSKESVEEVKQQDDQEYHKNIISILA